MGLLYALKQVGQGNFENAFNGVFESDDLLAAQQAVNDNQSKIIARQQVEGLVSAEQAQKLYSQMAPNTDSSAYWGNDDPWNTFTQTLDDEASSIGQFGSKAINKTLGLGFKIIPWQVWVAAFILLLIYLYPFWRPLAMRLANSRSE